MKRILAGLMCMIFCFGLVGCDKETIEERNNEAKTVLTSVLNKEKSFTVRNPYIDKTTEETLEKFRFPTYSNALNVFVPGWYTFVDFDADGIEELLIVEAGLTDFLFLRYDGDEVYGYVLKRISIQDVKTDGSFLTFDYDGFNAISRISFSEDSYEITYKAYKDDSEGTYLLDGQSISQEDVEKVFDDWNQNTTKVTWEEIQS